MELVIDEAIYATILRRKEKNPKGRLFPTFEINKRIRDDKRRLFLYSFCGFHELVMPCSFRHARACAELSNTLEHFERRINGNKELKSI